MEQVRLDKLLVGENVFWYPYSEIGGVMMKIVETPWERLYKFVLFMFGIPLLLIGAIILAIYRNWAIILIGSIWIIFAVELKIKNVYNKHRLESLKKEGICYDGTVVKIIPKPWVRIGSYVTAQVECLYKTEKGDGLVRSGYHLLLPFDRREDLYAKIYLDSNNLEKHSIELFRKDTGVSI